MFDLYNGVGSSNFNIVKIEDPSDDKHLYQVSANYEDNPYSFFIDEDGAVTNSLEELAELASLLDEFISAELLTQGNQND